MLKIATHMGLSSSQFRNVFNCMLKFLFINESAFRPTGSAMAALFFVLQHVLVKLTITTYVELSSSQFCSLICMPKLLFNNQFAFRPTDSIVAALFCVATCNCTIENTLYFRCQCIDYSCLFIRESLHFEVCEAWNAPMFCDG
jgi:hypothetical protein